MTVPATVKEPYIVARRLKVRLQNSKEIKLAYLCTYDLCSLINNIFDACRSITKASGRGLGPGNRDFFGPKKWQREKRVPFGPKKVGQQKHYMQGCIKHR
jgi:hypothetical protein